MCVCVCVCVCVCDYIINVIFCVTVAQRNTGVQITGLRERDDDSVLDTDKDLCTSAFDIYFTVLSLITNTETLNEQGCGLLTGLFWLCLCVISFVC